VAVTSNDEVGDLAASFNSMAASLETTEKRRLDLVGDVAHELRTPLATIDSHLEGLQDGLVRPSSETWQLLRGETERLSRLVNDLQELWRAEAGQLPLSITRLDAGPQLQAAADRFAASAHEQRVALVVEPVTGLVMRTESSWTTNALQTDTTKPDLFADANIVRWVIGVDRPTFIRPLNATRTFFLSAQAFGTHLIDINAGRFGSPNGANDNFIFTAFAQTQYMRDRLIILVFGAFGTTGKDGTTGGNVEYLISDNWSAQLGVTAFLGSRQEHDLTTFAVFTGDGRPFSESGFGIGHMQAGGAERNQMNEFWGRLRYRF